HLINGKKTPRFMEKNSRNTIDKLVDMLVVTALLPLGAVTGNATELAQRQVARTELMQQTQQPG
ncbi:hypothetical protein PSYPI_40084, partial [Pseudomonas syringae pv. pisi str. 1704B]